MKIISRLRRPLEDRQTSIAPRRGLTILLFFLLYSTLLVLASCQEGSAFGIKASRLDEILAGDEAEALIAIDEKELGDYGYLGSDSYYYLARWIQAREGAKSEAGAARFELLLRMGLEKASGLARLESARTLASRLTETKRWEELVQLGEEARRILGSDWAIERRLVEALDGLGRDVDCLAALSSLRSVFPAEAAKDAEALAYFEAAARARLGQSAAIPELRAVLVDRPASAWTKAALDLVASLSSSSAASPAFAEALITLSPSLLAVARMRVFVRERDYGPALREAEKNQAFFLSAAPSAELVSDLGKAYLYSGSPKEGAERLTAIEAAARASVAALPINAAAPPSAPLDALEARRAVAVAWTALFYRGRFARALERWDEAARLFGEAARSAPAAKDGDSALWYSVECAIKGAKAAAATAQAEAAQAAAAQARAAAAASQAVAATQKAAGTKAAASAAAAKAAAAKAASDKAALRAASATGVAASAAITARRKSLDALITASFSWKDPANFSDLADALFRDAISARDWFLIEAFAEGLADSASPTIAARALYASARALELGLYPPPRRARAGGADPDDPGLPSADERAEKAAARFDVLAADREAPLHYRVLAAWRIDGDPDLIPPASRAPEPPREKAASEAFIEGFLRFRLAALGVEEARARAASFDDEALRRLSAAFANAEAHDSSIRIMSILASRPSWLPRRADYELLYSRPFLSEYRALRPRPDIPEHIFYGLLRSESLFRSDVKSSAGAIGVSQLMPATAAMVAKDLGLSDYDLSSITDNLRIGSAFFADLLADTKRPLRAMWAYNAGGSRLRKWLEESGDLPDDLMIEALGLEETRQYGRNIVSAAALYGELYYELRASRVAGEIVMGEEKEKE